MLSTLPELNEIPAACRGISWESAVAIGTCKPEPQEIFRVLEYATVFIFTLEYVAKILTVHSVRFELLDEFFMEDLLTGDDLSGKQRELDGRMMTTVRHACSFS